MRSHQMCPRMPDSGPAILRIDPSTAGQLKYRFWRINSRAAFLRLVLGIVLILSTAWAFAPQVDPPLALVGPPEATRSCSGESQTKMGTPSPSQAGTTGLPDAP